MDYEEKIKKLDKDRQDLIQKEKLWDEIAEQNKNMKRFTEGKYKDYAPCSERVKAFYKVFPNGAIRRVNHRSKDSNTVVIEARVYALCDDARTLIANGFAEEVRADKGVNEDSYIENAETSAVGRALRNAGFGLLKEYSPVKLFSNEYIRVEQRIQEFRQQHPLGKIISTIVSDKPVNIGGETKNLVFTTTKVFSEAFVLDESLCRAEGSALEDRDKRTKNNKETVNTRNCIENAETSSIGRALGLAGFATGESIASAEEVYSKGEEIEGMDTSEAIGEETIGKEGEDKIVDWLKKNNLEGETETYLSFLGKESFSQLTKTEAENFMRGLNSQEK